MIAATTALSLAPFPCRSPSPYDCNFGVKGVGSPGRNGRRRGIPSHHSLGDAGKLVRELRVSPDRHGGNGLQALTTLHRVRTDSQDVLVLHVAGISLLIVPCFDDKHRCLVLLAVGFSLFRCDVCGVGGVLRRAYFLKSWCSGRVLT